MWHHKSVNVLFQIVLRLLIDLIALTARNHQRLVDRLPQPATVTALPDHPVQRRQRLGAMLSYYHRAAA